MGATFGSVERIYKQESETTMDEAWQTGIWISRPREHWIWLVRKTAKTYAFQPVELVFDEEFVSDEEFARLTSQPLRDSGIDIYLRKLWESSFDGLRIYRLSTYTERRSDATARMKSDFLDAVALP